MTICSATTAAGTSCKNHAVKYPSSATHMVAAHLATAASKFTTVRRSPQEPLVSRAGGYKWAT